MLWPYVVTVLLSGLLACAATWNGGALAAAWPALLPCALLALYGEKRALYIAGFGALNFGEPVYFAVALLHGPTAAGLLAAGLGLAGDLLQKKSLPVLTFNIGWALLTFIAVGVSGARLGPAAPAFVACLGVYLIVAGTLQAVAMRLLLDLPLSRTIREQITVMRYSGLAVLSIGGVVLMLLARQPWAVLLLGFPLEILTAYVERERLHRQLVAAQAAALDAEKRAAVSLLGAGVAHELNSPLAAILVNCHMLRIPTLLAEERERCVGIVEKAALRARDIVSALLTYARPPAAESACAPMTALADCLLLLGDSLAPARVETPSEALPAVRLGAGPLMQVFTNLLMNARQAVETGEGVIEVSGEVIGDRVVIRVSDNGSGIAPSDLPRIWDPFFTTRPPGQGTGLGLAVVRGVVEQAGGRIEVERTGRDGTVFRVELPRAVDQPVSSR
jgi:signal transduction histidine kinase